MRKVANLVVGTPATTQTSPAHVNGVRQGNRTGAIDREAGIIDKGESAVGTARRSTGINPERHSPIDPRMPNLSPA